MNCPLHISRSKDSSIEVKMCNRIVGIVQGVASFGNCVCLGKSKCLNLTHNEIAPHLFNGDCTCVGNPFI